MYRVKSLVVDNSGHWRAGRQWGCDWEYVEDSVVTQAMKDDPRLRIEATSEHASQAEYANAFSGPLPVDDLVAEVEEPSAEVEPETIADPEFDGKAPLPERGKRR